MANSTEQQVPDQESFRKYCVKRLSVHKEFVKLFYQVLYTAAFEGIEITHRQAFDLLNELYHRMTGKYRYESYESFYIIKIRKKPEA